MLSSLVRSQHRLLPATRHSSLTHQLPLRSLTFRRYSEVVASKVSLKPGDRLQGYQVHQVREVPELQLTAVTLKHESTGAEHLHIARDDTNNVFAVGFATPVSDNTGVPHILEHVTLCGSKQFPVRDPFFKMLNRSLATFMNAFTASDYTIYPFASTNSVDFNNLRNVYMDATFFPNLRELDFKQEGWRLEHEDPNDKSSPLVFKGVVYNEMKGALSDANSLFYSRMQQQMFPGTIYQYISGGDPQYITDLTHEQLVGFHRSHYHPSNAKFYTYGSFPLEDHLSAVHDRIKDIPRITPPTVNKIVTPWTSPRTVRLSCPPDPLSNPEKQAKMSVSFLTNDSTDVFETFAMRLLSHLLHDGHASPMYKALIDTNMGSEFSANTGYDSSTRTSSLSIGLQGISSNDVQLVEDTIKSVLQEVKTKGFDPKRVEAAIHQMELGQKHKTADFGLTIMHGVSSGWFNGTNPINLLEINKNIDRFKAELSSGSFFESLIDRYLLRNPHQLVFIMEPSPSYNVTLAEAEQTRLATKVAVLTEADRERVFEQGKQLLAAQEKVEDLECLPTLALSDVAPKARRVPLDHSGVGETPVQWRTTSTNGITYFRAISTNIGLPKELKMYLPLFCDTITSLGTHTRTMAEIDNDIRLYTGEISASTFLATNHSDLDQVEEGIVLTGSCLDRNINKMYELLTDLIQDTNFDNVDRLRTLILGSASSMVNSVADSGHSYALTFAGSTLTPAMATSELYGGMTQVDFMNRLAASEDLSDVVQKLKIIATHVLKQTSLRVAITCGEESVPTNENALSGFLTALPKGVAKPAESLVFEPNYLKSFFPLPFAVNFSAKVLRGVPYTHPDGAKLQTLSHAMTQYLHREIREKNGAYGGGARYNSLNGLLSFYSYRDPRTLETLETYTKVIDWVQQKKFTEQELVEAKLAIFQRVDAPLSVAGEGLVNFAEGINDDMRQRRREQLLNVTEDDIKEVAAKYLHQQEGEGRYSVTILGELNDRVSEEAGWKVHKWGGAPVAGVEGSVPAPAVAVA